MKEKVYTTFEEEEGKNVLHEPAVAFAEPEVHTLPHDIGYAHIVNGTLQITPDMEEEIAEAERGETVSMNEFNTMFAKWLA